MKNIIVIGSINQDIVIETNRIPNPGETVFGQSLHFFSGGKGVNQAIAAHNFSENVLFVGKIGNDIFGNNLLDYFNKIDLKYKVETIENSSTGTAIINVDKNGENAITLVKGANDNFKDSDLNIFDQFESNDILLIQNEINNDINHKAIQVAKSKGLTVFLNPAPSYKVPREIISLCDYIIVNEHELEEVFRLDSFSLIEDIEQELINLSIKFNTNIILTIGDKGSIATNKGNVIVNKGNKVNVKDTTGAGDCFCGVLVSALSNDLTLPESLKLANKAASISVTKLGASNSYPNAKDF